MSSATSVKRDDTQIQEASEKKMNTGWTGVDAVPVSGLLGMMHDGDQVFFNPYGPHDPKWTTYSFRPVDRDASLPWISIVPSSLRALDSMDTMLNNIPYVVIKEYFFKNTAATMINLVQKIMAYSKESGKKPDANDSVDNSQEKDSKGKTETKSEGNTLMDKVRDAFESVDLKMQVIDIPYILYCGLRKKLYGNTYIFPYLLSEDGSSLINQANNTSEWNGKGSSLVNMIKGAISNAADAVAGFSSMVTGSNAQFANLFPAPTWGGQGEDKISFSFDLMLVNDNIVSARNNYMCVNTMIHNNRSMQKAIMAFPGALYEIWLPTGQRHLMCTCDLKLYQLGVNRKVPKGFFSASDLPGANFRIGTVTEKAEVKDSDFQVHDDQIEVIPDGYKLSCTFQSCLANNLNTSIFQYYVKMTGYEQASTGTGKESTDDMYSKVEDTTKRVVDAIRGNDPKNTQDKSNGEPPKASSEDQSQERQVLQYRAFANNIIALADETSVEKFDESTYNKRLGKLRTQLGDKELNSDSVVDTIRRSQALIRETKNFLSKLYNAPDRNLWYKPFDGEEYYTTLKADARQILKKRYQDKFKEFQ